MEVTDPGIFIWLGVTLLVALLGSRVLGVLIEQAFGRSRSRRDRDYEDAMSALDALKKLRGAALRHEAWGAVSDPKRDEEMAKLANSLIIEVARLGRRELTEEALSYTLTAQLFAIRNEDTSAENESDSFFAVLHPLSDVSSSAR